jgi:hypothetical protein
MTTATQNAQSFEQKVKAQIEEANAKLHQLQATAKEKRTEAEAAAIAKLNTSREEIDRRVQDMKATHQEHVARAKSEIEADVARFKASVDEIAAKFKGSRK